MENFNLLFEIIYRNVSIVGKCVVCYPNTCEIKRILFFPGVRKSCLFDDKRKLNQYIYLYVRIYYLFKV